MRALGWASLAGLLCLWLTTTTTTYSDPTHAEASVVVQTPTQVLLPARPYVDLAMTLPEPVWLPLAGLLLVAAPMVSMALTPRRPTARQAPRAPPVASAL
jgi:hypothetical protein